MLTEECGGGVLEYIGGGGSGMKVRAWRRVYGSGAVGGDAVGGSRGRKL